MAEAAPAAATPAKSPKKKAASRTKKVGPTVSDLIVKAVSASKERSGVSLVALKKALAAEGYDVERNTARVKQALKGLVTKETLLQVKGTGASGSFRMNTNVAKIAAKKPVEKAAVKPTKPAAKKPAATKKGKKAPKKPAAKTKATTPKKKATNSPKKVVAKKATKKLKKVEPKKATKSPKKPKPTKRKTAKSTVVKTKKAAPKK